MNISPHVVWILVVMVGGIIAFGLATQWIAGVSRLWRELAGMYPPQPPAADATRGEAQMFLAESPEGILIGREAGCLTFFMPWTWFKGKQQVRYAVDDDHLHLDIESGRGGPKAPMSIPWADLSTVAAQQTWQGEHTVFSVAGMIIAFPSTAIQRELEVRRVLETEPERTDQPGEWEEPI